MSDRIIPEHTAPTEYTVDPETGETTLIIEHFRQGENRYRIVHSLAASVEGEDAKRQTPRRWTPLAIKRACGERWAPLKAALVDADLYEDFIMAQELVETDVAFARVYAWAVAQYGEEVVEAILSAATE